MSKMDSETGSKKGRKRASILGTAEEFKNIFSLPGTDPGSGSKRKLFSNIPKINIKKESDSISLSSVEVNNKLDRVPSAKIEKKEKVKKSKK